MATQSRINVFSDENHVLGGFPSADLRGKRAPITVLSEMGANHQINNCLALQPQNIPGFFDRKPLYARGPAKSLAAENENAEAESKTGSMLGDLLFGKLSTKTSPAAFDEVPRPMSMIGSPMAISPLVEDRDTLQKTTKKDEDKLLDDQYFTDLYGETHYVHLRSLELKLRPRYDYMRRQRDISSDMRSVLVDWLVEVNEEYQQSDESLFLTVSLIDRFLSMMSVVRGKLQLVGTAAILVAAKVEEIYPPQLTDLVYITDDTYTASQIIRMEALLLKNLEFFIGNAHALTFIQSFGIMAQISKRIAHMAQYICELSLLKIESLAFRPSELAAAAILLALHHIEGSIERWTPAIHEFSGIDSRQMQCAVNFLQTILLQANSSPHRAIRNKHAHRKYSSVSLLPVRPTAPHVETL
ncbi:G2/mitotic-specific cyclin-A [Galendromus occidentalis]|uniref:G2/mitotic-specific cyclin-A n=1 Tax=Galendromus occidentalis TaxID=34638 RepID=A0AAJ6VV64_9ACAR|nr:G2/mitotic-specific cyclin-A [Galendromus occidentalis]